MNELHKKAPMMTYGAKTHTSAGGPLDKVRKISHNTNNHNKKDKQE
jgi:hypothetical protein